MQNSRRTCTWCLYPSKSAYACTCVLPSIRPSCCCLLYLWNKVRIAPSIRISATGWAFSRACSRWRGWSGPRMTGSPTRCVVRTWLCAAARRHRVQRRSYMATAWLRVRASPRRGSHSSSLICTAGRSRLPSSAVDKELRWALRPRGSPQDTAVARCTSAAGCAALSPSPGQVHAHPAPRPPPSSSTAVNSMEAWLRGVHTIRHLSRNVYFSGRTVNRQAKKRGISNWQLSETDT